MGLTTVMSCSLPALMRSAFRGHGTTLRIPSRWREATGARCATRRRALGGCLPIPSVCEGVPDGAAAFQRARDSHRVWRPTPTHSRARVANSQVWTRVGIYEQIFRMAWLTVPSLWATPRSAASAPSTAAEFRAAGDASADASSAEFESSSDASKIADVPRRLCSNWKAHWSCAPVLVVGSIGAILFATVMMAATTSSPVLEARELSTARSDDDGLVAAQPAGFESTEFVEE